MNARRWLDVLTAVAVTLVLAGYLLSGSWVYLAVLLVLLVVLLEREDSGLARRLRQRQR